MEIYFIGYIVIILGTLFFFYSPKKLYALTVFSIPFTGTAVFQISSAAFSIEGIRASLFLGTLCLIRHFLSSLHSKKILANKRLQILIAVLFILGLVCSLSLVMPIIIDGKLLVLDSYSNLVTYAKPKPLYFSFQYVTQLAYFLFGCLLAYYFAVKNHDEIKLAKSINIYLYASLFVCLWGLLEFLLFYAEIPYPSFIFNSNSFAMNAQGTLVLGDRPRITSVSLEPSIMSQQLLTALPLTFWLVMGNHPNFRKSRLTLLLLLLVIVLLLSLSTTAIFGLVALALLVVLHYVRLRKINIYLLFGLILTFILLALVSPFLIQALLEKLSTYSGAERVKAIEFGWRYFTQYPLLGVGWGVFPSWDLVVCILAGAGVAGLAFFLLLLTFMRINFQKMKLEKQSTTITTAIGYSFVMLLLVSQFSGFIYHSQYFWLILGLTMAASSLRSSVKTDAEEMKRST